jgi:hypothetical protein
MTDSTHFSFVVSVLSAKTSIRGIGQVSGIGELDDTGLEDNSES